MATQKKKKERTHKRPSRTARFFENFTLDKNTKRRIWILFGLALVLLVIGLLINDSVSQDIGLVIAIPGGVLIGIIPAFLTAMSNNKLSRGVWIFIAIILLGVFFKRMHWPGAGVILSFSLGVFAITYFILAMKNYYTIQKNPYFRIISTVAAIFIGIMSTGMLFKIQHWPGAYIALQISILPSLIFTTIVLVTLPGSGYIKWPKHHKLIFSRKLLIPWIFYLLIAGVTLLLPQNISSKIFYSTSDKVIPFNMETYELEQAEGLEPDQ